MLVALKAAGWCCVVLVGSEKNRLIVMQATSQQVFKVNTFCVDARFQSFSPLISRIVCLPRSAEIQPVSQHAAAATCPYRGLVLNTHAPA